MVARVVVFVKEIKDVIQRNLGIFAILINKLGPGRDSRARRPVNNVTTDAIRKSRALIIPALVRAIDERAARRLAMHRRRERNTDIPLFTDDIGIIKIH